MSWKATTARAPPPVIAFARSRVPLSAVGGFTPGVPDGPPVLAASPPCEEVDEEQPDATARPERRKQAMMSDRTTLA